MKPTRTFRIAATAISASIPVLYMVAMHIYWMAGDRNAQLRMLMKHIGFWTGFAATIYTTHRFGFRAKTIAQALPIYAGASLLPIAGYEVFRRLAKQLFPKQPKAQPKQPSLDLANLLQTLKTPSLLETPAQPQAKQQNALNYPSFSPGFQSYSPWYSAVNNYAAYGYRTNNASWPGYASYFPYYTLWPTG